MAHFGPIKVPEGPSDERFLYLSDVLPTAWQAVAYADVPEGGSLAVYGLGPIGKMCVRVARQRGVKRWVDEIMPLLLDGDPLGTEDLATHRLPLDEAPRGYELFQRKEDGAVKVVLKP